jgi:hypothetical protein
VFDHPKTLRNSEHAAITIGNWRYVTGSLIRAASLRDVRRRHEVLCFLVCLVDFVSQTQAYCCLSAEGTPVAFCIFIYCRAGFVSFPLTFNMYLSAFPYVLRSTFVWSLKCEDARENAVPFQLCVIHGSNLTKRCKVRKRYLSFTISKATRPHSLVCFIQY